MVVRVAGGDNRAAVEVVLEKAELGVAAAQCGDGQGDGGVRLEFAGERQWEGVARESGQGTGARGKVGKKD